MKDSPDRMPDRRAAHCPAHRTGAGAPATPKTTSKTKTKCRDGYNCCC